MLYFMQHSAARSSSATNSSLLGLADVVAGAQRGTHGTPGHCREMDGATTMLQFAAVLKKTGRNTVQCLTRSGSRTSRKRDL